jgi:hypothetical protein
MRCKVHEGFRASILLGLGLMSILGCGEDDGIGQRYPVRGTVTLEGTPLTKGSVAFIAENPKGRNGSAALSSDGSYSAMTLQPGDGLLPGKYKVAVNAIEVDMNFVRAQADASGGGGFYRSDIIRKAPRKRHVPKKYDSHLTSELSVEVKPETNRYDIALTGTPEELAPAADTPLKGKAKGRTAGGKR